MSKKNLLCRRCKSSLTRSGEYCWDCMIFLRIKSKERAKIIDRKISAEMRDMKPEILKKLHEEALNELLKEQENEKK